MSLVVALQKHIINNEKNTTELLREALLIASKLQLNDFKLWINSELKGYTDDSVPKYRIVHSALKILNPYHGWQPTTIKNPEIDELINNKKIRDSISELEKLTSNSDNNELSISFSGSAKIQIMKLFETDYEPASFIGKSQVEGIIEQVKTTLLEWSIKLEEDGILGDEHMSFTEEEKETAQQKIHIENFNGIMGEVSNLGNFSTGNKNHNISTINTIESKIDTLIEKINSLPLRDKDTIIQDITESKDDKNKLQIILGELMTRGSEVATIVPAIGELLGLL